MMDTDTNATDTNATDTNDTDVWSALWLDKEQRDEFKLLKRNGSSLTLKKGSWVKLPAREDKCLIDYVYNLNESLIGPTGISYLPRRDDEQRFASKQWSMRGNPRFIVCYPEGRNNYGIQLDWDKLELCEPPENIDPMLVNAALDTP